MEEPTSLIPSLYLVYSTPHAVSFFGCCNINFQDFSLLFFSKESLCSKSMFYFMSACYCLTCPQDFLKFFCHFPSFSEFVLQGLAPSAPARLPVFKLCGFVCSLMGSEMTSVPTTPVLYVLFASTQPPRFLAQTGSWRVTEGSYLVVLWGYPRTSKLE